MKTLSLSNAKTFRIFAVSNIFEIYPSPILQSLKKLEFKISAPDDLLRSSLSFGFKPLFVHDEDQIQAEVNGKEGTVSNVDFVNWQLRKMTSAMLYELINKVEPRLSELFDFDEEYDRDEDYAPDEWLNGYNQNEKHKGIDFIDRLRNEKSDEFFQELVRSILHEHYGVLNWLETRVDEKMKALKKYKAWDQPLAIVWEGLFFPYLEDDLSTLAMDEYRLSGMYVRNYDEGDIE